MSDYAINLLRAIESGDQAEMDAAFNDAMSNKISDAIDARKIEVAQAIYSGGNTEQESSDEAKESSDDDQLETSEEDGTEEV